MDAQTLATPELEAGLGEIRQSPRDNGRLDLIVRRPAANKREVLAEGELDVVAGLVGDGWRRRMTAALHGEEPDPDTQLTLMNSRVVALLAQDRARWALAGDQLFVDLDLSEANLPPGTRLAIGAAVIEVTAEPHAGCQKFVSRFGVDAMKFVNSPLGRSLHMRGIYAKVVVPGRVRVGDVVAKTR